METIRWKRLLIATDTGQQRRLTLQLDANEIRHAMGRTGHGKQPKANHGLWCPPLISAAP
jgi:hypothetical protein